MTTSGRAAGAGPISLAVRSYVDEQVSIAVGRPIEVPEDLAAQVWTVLSRSEERGAGRDAHGNFPASESRLHRDGLLERPPLLDVLATTYEEDARWPEGYRFAAVLTHDVDRIVSLPARERWRQAVSRGFSAGVTTRLRWAARSGAFALRSLIGENDRDPFGAYMSYEAAHGFHSTFFVLSDRLVVPTRDDHWYRLTDEVRYGATTMPFAGAAAAVHEAGWDIGLHGSYSSYQDAEILRAERERLEEAFGFEVTTTRQHFLRFDAERTPAAHDAAGLRADSTVGFSTTFGCRLGLALPFFWYGQPDLLEVPITIQDVGLVRARGRSLDVEEVTARASRLIEYVADRRGAVTLAWHTHPDRGALPIYEVLLDEVARLGGWGCSLAEMDSWWRTRREKVRRARSPSMQTSGAAD